MTTLEDLPDSILLKIIMLLPTTTMYRFAEACPKVDILLRDQIGIMVETNEGGGTVNPCVGRKDKYVWIYKKGDDRTNLLYVAAVHVFLFDARLPICDYTLLAERFHNLKVLCVGWLNLKMLGEIGTWLTFPNLNQLRLGGPENKRMSQIKEYSGNEVLGNLSGFLSIISVVTYPNLTTFAMNIIFEKSREKCLLDSLLKFLTRHQNSLQSLVITMASTSYPDHRDRIENWLSVPNWEERLGNLALHLQNFALYFYPYYEYENFLQLVDHISNSQTLLKIHTTFYPRFQSFYTDLLEDNFRTLTQVALSIWIFYTLDSKVFEQCSVLQMLHLHARPKKLTEFETENYRGEPASSELLNIECLPKSLTEIAVVNFFIETKDCVNFTTAFPKLEQLLLIGIGEKEALGFTLEMFSLCVHQGVQTGIYRGFNQKSKLKSQLSNEGTRVFMNLFGLPEKISNFGWGANGLLHRNVNLSPYYLAVNQCLPIPFDDGQSKFKVYIGQEEW